MDSSPWLGEHLIHERIAAFPSRQANGRWSAVDSWFFRSSAIDLVRANRSMGTCRIRIGAATALIGHTEPLRFPAALVQGATC